VHCALKSDDIKRYLHPLTSFMPNIRLRPQLRPKPSGELTSLPRAPIAGVELATPSALGLRPSSLTTRTSGTQTRKSSSGNLSLPLAMILLHAPFNCTPVTLPHIIHLMTRSSSYRNHSVNEFHMYIRSNIRPRPYNKQKEWSGYVRQTTVIFEKKNHQLMIGKQTNKRK